jgi:hypothetical protein
MPCLLSEEQESPVDTCHAWKTPRIPFEDNTGDGMWVYEYEAETKQHSVEEPIVSTMILGFLTFIELCAMRLFHRDKP